MKNDILNGSGKRKCDSWIQSFIDYTDNLESDPIFRKWAAITVIAAALEQKVWVYTTSNLYPNLYTFLVGHAGIGKSNTIKAVLNFYRQLPEPMIAPTSVTMASLVDRMKENKRTIIQHPNPPDEYNTILIAADELSAFMHEYKGNELIPGLTTFYDCGPYGQARRTNELNINIPRPQVNILTGTTPSNLLQFIPEYAWEQGFTSRILLIYADKKPLIDIFSLAARSMPADMIHDLKVINGLYGQFGWSQEWAKAMWDWKQAGFIPVPNHPKLRWYNERRHAHMIKLSMISSIDRGNRLELTKQDFNNAMFWLLEAEAEMSKIFTTGSATQDSAAFDEVVHFVQKHGTDGVSEHLIWNYARTKITHAYNIKNIMEAIEKSGYLRQIAVNPRTGLRTFRAVDPNQPPKSSTA